MPAFDPHIFRAYDIRGVVGKNVTEELCRLVGKGFGSELRERYKRENPTVIVGRDARTHGPKLEKALIDGLISSGCHVKTIGQTPTPVNYFALCHFECDGSVQVTASHNAKEDNGLKLQIRDAEAFSGDELQQLMKRIEEERFENGEGSVEELDAIAPYVERVTSLVAMKHASSTGRRVMLSGVSEANADEAHRRPSAQHDTLKGHSFRGFLSISSPTMPGDAKRR